MSRLVITSGDVKALSTSPDLGKETIARERLAEVARKLEWGEALTDNERHQLARNLLEIASGESASRIFGFRVSRGGQPKTDRDAQLLRDYALRRERGDKQVQDAIADAWILGLDSVAKITKGAIKTARRRMDDEIKGLTDEYAGLTKEAAIRMIQGDIEIHRDRLVRGPDDDPLPVAYEATFTDQDGNTYIIKG